MSTRSMTIGELFDSGLLSQAPARPDRRRAADWALRAGLPSKVGKAGGQQRLASVYLAAHTDTWGRGLAEPDRMARACGLQPAEIQFLMHQLTATGALGSWRCCPYTGDLHWTL